MSDMGGSRLSDAAQRFQDFLRTRGYAHRVVENTTPTRSAAEAAAVLGCEIAQIAKSIVFRASTSGRPVMAVTSGANRVDETKLAALAGEALGKANADFVRWASGFAIGGVPPVGHAQPIAIFIDRDLLGETTIWAAAGSPNALFSLTPLELVEMTGGQIADLKA
jgi:prolyl-tRNA editing enzyme YbaK/EbsC (Cys-tRNA(Pro) deacylase)